MRTRYPSETIPRSRRLRRDATEPEIRLWWKLRELKPLGYHFRRQVPFRFYFLDFVEHRFDWLSKSMVRRTVQIWHGSVMQGETGY